MRLKFSIMATVVTIFLGTQAYGQGYISVDEHGNPIKYSAEELSALYGGSYDESALEEYTAYAERTAGVVGFCPKFVDLPLVMDQVLEAVTKTKNNKIDIALLLDTTGSMGGEIEAVKANLQTLLEKLRKNLKNQSIRVAVLEYKDGSDQGDDFINRIISDFTSDFQTLQALTQAIQVSGGGDHREAILDGLEVTDEALSWRASSEKNVILIGDAPGHIVSKTSQRSVDQILDQLNGRLAVHPILVTLQ